MFKVLARNTKGMTKKSIFLNIKLTIIKLYCFYWNCQSSTSSDCQFYDFLYNPKSENSSGYFKKNSGDDQEDTFSSVIKKGGKKK